MFNDDFWVSVQQIISEGFTPEGLTKLDEYAEQFTIGRLVYQRFSPREQHGCAAGGSTHVIASLLAAASYRASGVTAPIGSFQVEQQCATAQATCIENWAKKAGCWLDNVEQYLTQQLGEQVAEGGEAHVYYHGATLCKSIGLDYYIQPILALDRISLHNAYFPETRLSVIGFGKSSEGEFRIVVEQPFIAGKPMMESDIEQYAIAMGFALRNAKNWTYATPEIYLSDLHDENVIRSDSGSVFVIDCDIRINTPDLKQGGIRQWSTEITQTHP
ncbi:MAG: hypothetical protein MJZ55_01245 [Paludibacteraceae bacterium]|nr:hypothetical protein [Paludibacteraceae bacterium]